MPRPTTRRAPAQSSPARRALTRIRSSSYVHTSHARRLGLIAEQLSRSCTSRNFPCPVGKRRCLAFPGRSSRSERPHRRTPQRASRDSGIGRPRPRRRLRSAAAGSAGSPSRRRIPRRPSPARSLRSDRLGQLVAESSSSAAVNAVLGSALTPGPPDAAGLASDELSAGDDAPSPPRGPVPVMAPRTAIAATSPSGIPMAAATSMGDQRGRHRARIPPTARASAETGNAR